MSYILDALNKSEKERASRRLQQTPQQEVTAAPTGWRLVHTLLLVAFIMVFNATFIYFYLARSSPAPAVTGSVAATQPGASPASPDTRGAAIAASPVPVPRSYPAATEIRPTVALMELPLAIRRILPEIVITSHIYASDPSLRLVKIDGESRKEGDQLGQQHYLVGITETGVILDFQGYRYRLDILEDWQDLNSGS